MEMRRRGKTVLKVLRSRWWVAALADHVPQLVGHFRPVRRLQLSHDAADMHFYGAFAQVELVGDDLVRLALAQRFDHVCFPRSEDAMERPCTVCRRKNGFAERQEGPRGNEYAPGTCQPYRFGGYLEPYIRRDIASCAALESGEYLHGVVRIGDDDDRSVFECRYQIGDFILGRLLGDLPASQYEQKSGRIGLDIALPAQLIDRFDGPEFKLRVVLAKAPGQTLPIQSTSVDDDDRADGPFVHDDIFPIGGVNVTSVEKIFTLNGTLLFERRDV